MKMTYTEEKLRFLDGTQNTNNASDANLISYFQSVLDGRYQLILGELNNWLTEVQRTAVTKAGTQFYHNPVGVVQIESCTVQVGTIYYPMEVINSQYNWDKLNELLITTSQIPQFIFPRRDDFGIWPTPQAAYNIVLNYDMRDRKLTQDDYTAGTVSVSTNNRILTGLNTVWTSAMVGRWFKLIQDGYWYRISDYIGPTQMQLETSFEGNNYTGAAYLIGECPELPEEAHQLLYRGAIGDFYAEVKGDIDKAEYFNNVFWTGDGSNKDRTGDNIRGGLIGLSKRYAARADTKIIKHMGSNRLANTKAWGTKILP